MPFTQILIEIHLPVAVRVSSDALQVARRFFRGMDEAGYRMFSAEPDLLGATDFYKFSFIKVNKQGYFVTE